MHTNSILIVDDEKAARYGMKKILQRDHGSIFEATNGIDVLQKNTYVAASPYIFRYKYASARRTKNA